MSSSAVNPWSPFYEALREKTGFDLVGETVSDTQLRLTGRVPKAGMSAWLKLLEMLLQPPEDCPWGMDISKQYFVRAEGLRYAWRVIVQGEDLVSNLGALVATVRSVVEQSAMYDTRVMEVPLPGAGPNRNSTRNKRGKGAQPTLKAVTGVMQKQRMNF